MRYNQKLEDKIDHHFIGREDIVKKKQMGGVGWLIQGNMCCGIYEDLLVIRVDPTLADTLTEKPDIRIFGNRKGEQDSIISIAQNIYSHSRALHKFLDHCFDYTATLPPNNSAQQPSPS